MVFAQKRMVFSMKKKKGMEGVLSIFFFLTALQILCTTNLANM